MPARVRLTLMLAASLVIVVAVAIVLLTGDSEREGAFGSQGFQGSLRPEIPPQDFRLRDQDGRQVSLSDFRGSVTIVTFMYSTCEDTCPTMASQIRLALDDLDHDVPVLAISVDPENDTPDSAQAFLHDRGLSGGRMRFLLGSRDQLEPIWSAYGIQPQGEGFDHSAYVLLVDRDGRQRVSFPAEHLTPDGLAHDVRLLETES